MKVLFIGRWCPFHEGHKYIVDSYAENGQTVIVAVRDTDEEIPAQVRKRMIEAVYRENPLVQVIVIPDIDMVAVSRNVGYGILEVPEDIKIISGTKIRAGEQNAVPPAAAEVLKEWKCEDKAKRKK
jgi:adenylylsulfate kinase